MSHQTAQDFRPFIVADIVCVPDNGANADSKNGSTKSKKAPSNNKKNLNSKKDDEYAFMQSLLTCLHKPHSVSDHTVDDVFALDHIKDVYNRHITTSIKAAHEWGKFKVKLDEEKEILTKSKSKSKKDRKITVNKSFNYNEYYSNHPPILLYGVLGSGAYYITQAVCNENNMDMLRLSMDYIYSYCGPKNTKKIKNGKTLTQAFFDKIFQVLLDNKPCIFYVHQWQLSRHNQKKAIRQLTLNENNNNNNNNSGNDATTTTTITALTAGTRTGDVPTAQELEERKTQAQREEEKMMKQIVMLEKSQDTQYAIMSMRVRLLIERINTYNASLHLKQAQLVLYVEYILAYLLFDKKAGGNNSKSGITGLFAGLFGESKKSSNENENSENGNNNNNNNNNDSSMSGFSMYNKMGIPKDICNVISKYIIYYPSKFIQVIGNSFEPWFLTELEMELFAIKLYCNLPNENDRLNFLTDSINKKILRYNMTNQQWDILNDIFTNRTFHTINKFVQKCLYRVVTDQLEAKYWKQIPQSKVFVKEKQDDNNDDGDDQDDINSDENESKNNNESDSSKQKQDNNTNDRVKTNDDDEMVWIVTDEDDPDATQQSFIKLREKYDDDKILNFLSWDSILEIAELYRNNPHGTYAKGTDFARYDRFHQSLHH